MDKLRPFAVLWFWTIACAQHSTAGDGNGSGGVTDAGSGDAGGTIGLGGSWPSGGAGGNAPDGAVTGGAAGIGGQAGAAGASGGTGGCSAGGAGGVGPCGSGGPCEFPQNVPDGDFIASACTYQDTDPTVDAAVNDAMVSLSGCSVGSDCPITLAGTTVDEICQSWFAAVVAKLRQSGYCAGQHAVGSTDEIAVSNTCCEGKWFGYHICNYGGPKVVWNPGARRGWWMIAPSHCAP